MVLLIHLRAKITQNSEHTGVDRAVKNLLHSNDAWLCMAAGTLESRRIIFDESYHKKRKETLTIHSLS